MREDESTWNDLWLCTIIGEMDGFNLDLCPPDEKGRQVANLARFFTPQDIELFFNYPCSRGNILCGAALRLQHFLNGESIYYIDEKLNWEFE